MNLADCYRILGLRTGASYEEIKISYRRLARRYHPDVSSGSQQHAEKFIQLTDAYRQLINAVSPISPPLQAAKPQPVAPDRPTSQPTVPVQPTTTNLRPQPAIQKDPDASPTDHRLKEHAYVQLQQMLREQRFPRAIALIEGLAQRLPNDMEVRQWQAIAYQRWGRHLVDTNQPDKARLYLKKALRTDPRNKALWFEVDRDMQRLEGIEIF
jgi:tetratricopeptide (TPR) repeat protein